jgi:hypothetical protein
MPRQDAGGAPAARYFAVTGRCAHDAHRTPISFPGVLVDIEARLGESAAAAREANALPRAVIEPVPALFLVKIRASRMRIANKATLDLIGKPWSEVPSRTDADFRTDRAQAEFIMATDRRLMTSFAPALRHPIRIGPRTPAGKSFLVLFFKKEHLLNPGKQRLSAGGICITRTDASG